MARSDRGEPLQCSPRGCGCPCHTPGASLMSAHIVACCDATGEPLTASGRSTGVEAPVERGPTMHCPSCDSLHPTNYPCF